MEGNGASFIFCNAESSATINFEQACSSHGKQLSNCESSFPLLSSMISKIHE